MQKTHHSITSPGRPADDWLFYFYLALMVWLPLPLGSNRPWAWALMEVWVFILTAFWLIGYWRGRVTVTPVLIKARPVIILFAAWLLWLSLQLMGVPEWLHTQFSSTGHHLYGAAYQLTGGGEPWLSASVDRNASIAFFLKSLAYFGLFLLTLVLLNRHKRIRLLSLVIVLSGAFQAFWGGLMTLSGIEYLFFVEKESFEGVATGTYVNRNHFAGYLEMCLAVGTGLLLADVGGGGAISWRQRVRDLIQWILSPKMRLRIYLAVMVIGLVLSHSRMGNTAFFSSLLITGVLWFLLSKNRPKRSVLLLLASLLVIDIYIVGSWFGIDKVVERLENTEVTSERRDEVVDHTLTYAGEYPLFGSGGGSFYSTFPGYRRADVGSGFYDHAHNDYLEILAETGWPGLLLAGLTVLLSLGVAVKVIAQRSDPLFRGLGFAGVMGVMALMIHSMVDFNLQIPANAALFSLLLGLIWVAYGYRRGGNPRA